MRAVNGSSVHVPKVPKFEANDRLKFTADQQRAIQAAERGFGSRPDLAVRPPSSPGLGLALACALAYLLFLTLVVAALRPPESPREREAPMAEAIQRQAIAQTISSTLIFPSEEGSINQLPQVETPITSELNAFDPVGAPGQITLAGSASGLPTRVIGEEDER